MPSRIFALTTALTEWFQIHGKVVFTFGVFNVLLIVFCVVYWGIELPKYPLTPLNTADTTAKRWFTMENSLLSITNMFDRLYTDLSDIALKFDGLHTDFSDIVFHFYFMQFWIFFFTAYMVYILRGINGTLKHTEDNIRELNENFTSVFNFIRYEPEDLRQLVQGVQAMKGDVVRGVQAMKDNVDEKCDGFEDLLKKIIRIMPEHPIDIRDALYSFQDMTEDLLTKIKKELRVLRMDLANDGEEKEEMVELSASSAEASGEEESEVPIVPTITPRPKRRRKPNTSTSSSSSSSSSTPLLGSTRLGSRRANEMIQATQ